MNPFIFFRGSHTIRRGFRLFSFVVVSMTAASATLVAAQESREPLLVEGRFFCSVKRVVLFPFGGVVDELLCDVGRPVTNGQPLVRYRLFPDAAQELHRRLNAPQVAELELQQLQAENRLAQVIGQLEETRRLAEQRLSSPAQLEYLEREVSALQKQAETLRSREHSERRLAEEDATMLMRLLATPLASDETPGEVNLTTPIDGWLIAIEAHVAPGAEVAQYSPALQVAVMDPMILRAQVHEREAVQLTPGAAARVTATSLSGSVYTGTLRRVSWAPVTKALDEPAYYEIEVVVPNPGLRVKEGFQGRLEFDFH